VQGFTIVELLVVIVVIAILAAITIVAYNGIQARSRDSIRKSDIDALAKALELHYIDNGSYTQPEQMCSDTSYGGLGGCGDSGGTGDWDAHSDLRDLVTDGLLNSLPRDPTNDATYNYSYEPSSFASNGFDGYTLCAKLETTGSNYCLTQHK
jgi:prepilin-type N-terminal cleavage/methylation domain-containing protein